MSSLPEICEPSPEGGVGDVESRGSETVRLINDGDDRKHKRDGKMQNLIRLIFEGGGLGIFFGFAISAQPQPATGSSWQRERRGESGTSRHSEDICPAKDTMY